MGLHGCEACIINDLYQGLRLGSYVRTRGWSAQEVDTAIAALRQRGWLEGDRLSEAGREAREAMETTTDQQQRPIIETIGKDFEELVALLTPGVRPFWWGEAIQDGPLSNGKANAPHECNPEKRHMPCGI